MPEHLGFNLNDEQYRAVTHFDSPLIVLAGPGSGKTLVIVHRIAHLIREKGIEPESIVALTFTNKAAEEMRRRLAGLVGSTAKAERIVASTFHSFGLRLIRRFADLQGWRAEPFIIDEAQQRALMRQLAHETRAGLQTSPHDPSAAIPGALHFIGKCRNSAVFPEEAIRFGEQWAADFESRLADLDGEERLAEETRILQYRERARLYELFEQACVERGWVTFDDLQSLALRLLRENERARAIVRTEYQHLVVDEFQDVNRAQIELLRCLARTDHDLCVVGDDDQAIYGFRGSLPDGFRHVSEHWPSTQVIELSKNYRSSKIVVDAADRIIARCESRFKPDKTLVAAGPNADCELPIEAITYIGQSGAGPVIGQMILDRMDREEKSWSDFAVLVRTHTDLDRIAASLQTLEIPIDIPERSSLLDHTSVQDVMSWLRVLADPTDEAHVIRLLARPPFHLDLPTISNWQRAHRLATSERAHTEYENECAVEDTSISDTSDTKTDLAPTFLEYLFEHVDEPAVDRFESLYRELLEQAGTELADEVVLAIIHSTGLLALDPVTTDAHQARVEELGQFLGFVRERLPMIEQPKRARHLLEYIDDLEAANAPIYLGATAEDRMDSGVELSDRDAVRLLTAHKSKGLEFDTVFIPQVNSPTGYPLRRGGGSSDDEDLVPEALTGDAPADREDEERRIFFVALTRAERRAVLLTMTKYDSGRNRNPSEYWKEIVEQGVDEDPIPVLERSADEIVDESEDEQTSSDIARHVDLFTETAGTEVQRAIRMRERYHVRHEVYSILHALSDASLSTQQLHETRERLTRIAMRLPILAAEAPAELARILDQVPSDLRGELQGYAESIENREPWFNLLPPPLPPLDLSYSDIDLYDRCPRCYWLRKIVGLSDRRSRGAAFGSIIHRSLEFFYRRFRDAESGELDVAPPTLDDLLKLGHDSYNELRDPDEAWSRQTEEQIEQALRNYHQRLHSPDLNPVEIERAIVFDFEHAGHTHRMHARIDRIDFDGDGHHVIDYKTGRPTKTRQKPAPSDLQMGIYLIALQAFFEEDDLPGSAQYWLVPSGERGVIEFDRINLKKTREKIGNAIDGILAGNWEKKRADCRNCELLAHGWSPDCESDELEMSP